MAPNIDRKGWKKTVSFSPKIKLHVIYEDSEWLAYRKEHWKFVTADRLRIEDAISRVLEKQHRDTILRQNGIV